MATAFVPIRLSSSRLPEKHLLPIGDRLLLGWVVHRLKQARTVERIVLCVPDEPLSDKVASFARDAGVECFRYLGDVNDVIGRLTAAARHYQADVCVLASGDCPLLVPETIDGLVDALQQQHARLANFAAWEGRGPIHEGMLVAERSLWEEANAFPQAPALREHHFIPLRFPEYGFPSFATASFLDKPIYYRIKHRISVDTASDLEFMRDMHRRLKAAGQEFTLEHVLTLLEREPALAERNRHVKQKGLKDRSLRLVMVATAAGRYGMGNLMRALDVSRELVDRYGMGVAFRVWDHTAAEYVQRAGFTVSDVGDPPSFDLDASACDAVVLDLNKQVELSEGHVALLRGKSNRPVIVIDNVHGAAKLATKIIVPTAHHSRDLAAPRVLSGAEFVVVRAVVRALRVGASPFAARKFILVDGRDPSQRAQCEKHLAAVRAHEPGLIVRWMEAFDDSFPVLLAQARYLVAPFGVSAYEALYLGTTPVVFARDRQDEAGVLRFYMFANDVNAVGRLGNGAARIADEIASCVKLTL